MLKAFIEDLIDMGWEGLLFSVIVIALIVLMGMSVYCSIKEEKEWDQYVIDHKCKVTGHIKGSTQTGLGFGAMSNGQMGTVVTSTTIPDKIAYTCDDGITYWR